jgi:tetratricopeptide (TPR) repeat protein
MKCAYLMVLHRFDEAVRASDAGIAADPNYPGIYGIRAAAEISLGLFDQAKSDLRQAMRLSPRDPMLSNLQVQLGDVEIGAGRTENAIVEYQKALDAGSRAYWTYANLAAAYALLGKTAEAKPYLAEALSLNPKLTVKWFREHAEDIPARSEGLLKAGLPEQ